MSLDDKAALIKAMRKAEEAFDKSLEKDGLDGAYFCLDLIGMTLYDESFTPESIIKFENYDAIKKQNEMHMMRKENG